MNLLSVVILLFLILETLNVIILYFAPDFDKGNSVGFFNAFEKSKEIPEVHALVKYLINWVAGTKLIFISLLVVVLLTGSPTTIFFSTIALIFSIATFFWRLYPLIRQMDKDNQITPAGYSKTLGYMIAAFLLIFTVALVVQYFR